MQIMHDSTSPQIKHLLPHSTVAGAMALPTINVRQGMFDGHALPPLYTSPHENNLKQHFHRNLEHLGIPKRPGAAKPRPGKI
jgi:hypothetical protein